MPAVSFQQPNAFSGESLGEILTDLMSLGLRVEDCSEARKGGAGPAEGKAIIIGGRVVNVPVGAHYVEESPYSLERRGDEFVVEKSGRVLCKAEPIPPPAFYGGRTTDGIPFRHIALLHGSNCLASTVIQACAHWRTGRRCGFCATEVSLRAGRTLPVKTPDHLAQAVSMAGQLDGVEHVVLTSGTSDPPGAEMRYLARCTRRIKETVSLPVHVQFQPPSDPGLMTLLREAGVDTVGIHVETFDRNVWDRVAPAKAALGVRRFEQAWKAAVDRFGPNQVSSFLIVGMGETEDSVVMGSEFLADLGVYPYVAPLRPIPGSAMEALRPPSPDSMRRIYERVGALVARKGLSAFKSAAGCVRCGACSGLSLYEPQADALVCHMARTLGELVEAFRIRKEVFVEEQGVFSESDRDEQDDRSVHLVARVNDELVGTVRMYPDEHEHGHWLGGRLAVRKAFRSARVGELLVQEAVKQVKRRGCVRFTAYIQEKNVPFFRKLGWKALGFPVIHCGRPHQRMEADLGVPEKRPWNGTGECFLETNGSPQLRLEETSGG